MTVFLKGIKYPEILFFPNLPKPQSEKMAGDSKFPKRFLFVSSVLLAFVFLLSIFVEPVSSLTRAECNAGCLPQCINACTVRGIPNCAQICPPKCQAFCMNIPASLPSVSGVQSSSTDEYCPEEEAASGSSKAQLSVSSISCSRYSDCISCVSSGKRCMWSPGMTTCFAAGQPVQGEVITSPSKCIAGIVPAGTYRGMNTAFDVNINPMGRIAVQAGGSVTISATVLYYGAPFNVKLGIEGVPKDTTVSLSPTSGSGRAVFIVKVPAGTKPGSYPISVVGVSSDNVRRAGATLVVSAPQSTSSSKNKPIQPNPIYGPTGRKMTAVYGSR